MPRFLLDHLIFILKSESLLHHHHTIDHASETLLKSRDLKHFIGSLLTIFSAHHIIECATRASVEFAPILHERIPSQVVDAGGKASETH